MGRGRDYLGSYRLIRMIRAGQTSQVWEAVNDTTREKVAIKSLVPEQRRNKQEIRNLRHEHTVAHTIDHENIVSIHDVDISGNIPYVVLDFVHGKNLKLMIRNEFETIAYQLPQLIIPMATSLGHLHKAGWVHCDVKPDNYMIDNELGVILIDFAIARKIRTGLGRLVGSIGKNVQGTLSYMAPEQIRGKALDGRTDIYGLGCSIYEMLTGKPPFTGATPEELLNKHIKAQVPHVEASNKNITGDFGDLLRQLMAKKPADRPGTMESVVERMKRVRVYNVFPKPPADKDAANTTDENE